MSRFSCKLLVMCCSKTFHLSLNSPSGFRRALGLGQCPLYTQMVPAAITPPFLKAVFTLVSLDIHQGNRTQLNTSVYMFPELLASAGVITFAYSLSADVINAPPWFPLRSFIISAERLVQIQQCWDAEGSLGFLCMLSTSDLNNGVWSLNDNSFLFWVATFAMAAFVGTDGFKKVDGTCSNEEGYNYWYTVGMKLDGFWGFSINNFCTSHVNFSW